MQKVLFLRDSVPLICRIFIASLMLRLLSRPTSFWAATKDVPSETPNSAMDRSTDRSNGSSIQDGNCCHSPNLSHSSTLRLQHWLHRGKVQGRRRRPAKDARELPHSGTRRMDLGPRAIR